MLFVKTGMVDYMAFNLTGMMLPVILSLQDARRNRTNGLYIYIYWWLNSFVIYGYVCAHQMQEVSY